MPGSAAAEKAGRLPSRGPLAELVKKPGQVGLANEARPGLGTRADDPQPAAASETPEEAESLTKPRATRLGYEEPRPEPREQDPNSFAHEEERSTGVSGHMGNA